jgi:hypothetical protein
MEPQIEALQGISDTLWAQDLYDRNESAKGARAALRAVAALPSTSTFARGSAIMWSALLKQMAGQGEDASQKLERLIDTDESPSVTARALLALCIMSRYAGHLERCQASAERLLAATLNAITCSLISSNGRTTSWDGRLTSATS